MPGLSTVHYIVMTAGCLAFGALVFLYSQHKISLGPEDGEMPEGESAEEVMKRAAALKGRFSKGLCLFSAVCALCGCALMYEYGFGVKVFACAAAAVLLLGLSLVDLAIFEIPPEYNLAIALPGLIWTLADHENLAEHLIGAVAVSGLFLAIHYLSGGNAMGGGDVKLMAALGLLLGWKQILLVLFLGSLLGSVIHIIRMKLSGKRKVLAFGPYLAMAGVLAMLFGDAIIGWYVGILISARQEGAGY